MERGWASGAGTGRGGRRRLSAIVGAAALTVAGAGVLGVVPIPAAATPVAALSPGAVTGFGAAPPLGAPNPISLASPVVAMERAPAGQGYWLLGADGGVFTFGDAGFYGSAAAGGTGPLAGVLPPPGSPGSLFTAMAATPEGKGYWLVNSFGEVGAFGDAGYFGSSLQLPGGFPRAPIVGIQPTPDGQGYWLVGADGGVFSFGDATFLGSVPGLPATVRPTARVVGMAVTPNGQGYWEVTAAGDVYSFGDAGFFGSLAGLGISPRAPIVGIQPTPDGQGYWLVGADGGVFSFGDAPFLGSLGAAPISARTPVVAMATSAGGQGYWLATTDQALPAAPLPSVVFRCDFPYSGPAIRPATIILACGDGNAYLDHLDWLSWTATAAQGTGLFVHNTCQPTCAQGTFVSQSVRVQLADPLITAAGEEFSDLSVQGDSGALFPPEVIPTNN